MPPKALTKPQIAALGEGTHRIAPNLYLRVQGASRTYAFRYYEAGKQRLKAIGPVQHVSLEDAKAKARDMASNFYHNGKLEAPPSKTTTFAEAARKVLAERCPHLAKPGARDWETSLLKFAAPIGGMPVQKITVADVRALLLPIWISRPDTADKHQTRIRIVLDYCIGLGYRTGENPANRNVIKPTMPPRPRKPEPKHREALPSNLLPGVFAKLRQLKNPAAFCLQLQLLCALRPAEAVNARWEEFDLAAGLWNIPAGRMKPREDFTVTLSSHALRLLEGMQPRRSGRLFDINDRSNKLRRLLQKVSGVQGVTAHGTARANFQDFAIYMGYRGSKWHLVQSCLSHKQAPLDRAYSRHQWLEDRRELMEWWGAFLTGVPVKSQLDGFAAAFQASGGGAKPTSALLNQDEWTSSQT